MRMARCRCGAVAAACEGSPVRVSVCHCLDCQRRSGSVFSAQARFPADQVVLSGETHTYTRHNDRGQSSSFHFCPTCGSTIAYVLEAMPGLIAIPTGAFADPGFDPPQFSVWEERKHSWVEINVEGIERQV